VCQQEIRDELRKSNSSLTKMLDVMREYVEFRKKIMPPICRVLSIAEVLTKDFKDCKTRIEIVKKQK
jgi:hypothetical protein